MTDDITNIDVDAQARRIRGLTREGGWSLASVAPDADPTYWTAKRETLADAYMRLLDADWGEQAARCVVAFAAEAGMEEVEDVSAEDRTVALRVLSALIEADARSRQSTRALQQDRPDVRSR